MKRKNKCANKKAFNTIDKCNKAIRRSYVQGNVMLRYYECPTCLDFHLTSKNVDPRPFKKFDKEVIAAQWNQFENIFNKLTKPKVVKLQFQTDKERQQANINKKISKKLEKQLSLKEAQLAIRSFKCLNGVSFMKITCILSNLDYSNRVWTKLSWLR